MFSIRRLLYFFAAFVDRCGEIAGPSALPLARGAFTLYLDSAPRRRGTLDRTSVHWDRESASPTTERDSSYLDERRVVSFLTPCFCLLAFRANEITWGVSKGMGQVLGAVCLGNEGRTHGHKFEDIIFLFVSLNRKQNYKYKHRNQISRLKVLLRGSERGVYNSILKLFWARDLSPFLQDTQRTSVRKLATHSWGSLSDKNRRRRRIAIRSETRHDLSTNCRYNNRAYVIPVVFAGTRRKKRVLISWRV